MSASGRKKPPPTISIFTNKNTPKEIILPAQRPVQPKSSPHYPDEVHAHASSNPQAANANRAFNPVAGFVSAAGAILSMAAATPLALAAQAGVLVGFTDDGGTTHCGGAGHTLQPGAGRRPKQRRPTAAARYLPTGCRSAGKAVPPGRLYPHAKERGAYHPAHCGPAPNAARRTVQPAPVR